MHLGNVFSALLAWLSVRRAGGVMVLRMEDLDPDRCRAAYAEQLADDLRWLGLDWDEGYQKGGAHGPYLQSERTARYAAAFRALEERGLVYPCYCTRAERLAASAPHRSDGQVVYSGKCRHLTEEERARLAQTRCPAWRLIVPDQEISFTDGLQGTYRENLLRDCVGSVIEKLGQRKGDLVEMTPVGDRMKVEFLIPARGLFGYRNDFLTDTKGEGIMASVFDSYAPYKGDISRRGMGSLISTETGDSITYGLFNAQERGTLFIGAGVPVYEGMIIGVANRGEDIVVNACRKKQLTNTRASGSDDALRLVPPRQMSLEQCLEFLADDELLEVTPKSLRMRKAILNHEQRMKSLKGKK